MLISLVLTASSVFAADRWADDVGRHNHSECLEGCFNLEFILPSMDRRSMVPRTCDNFEILLDCVTNCTNDPTCDHSTACDPGRACLRRIEQFNTSVPLCYSGSEDLYENFTRKTFELQQEVQEIAKYNLFGLSSTKRPCYNRCNQMMASDVCIAANPWPIRFDADIVKFYQIFTIAKTFSSLYEFYFNSTMAPPLRPYRLSPCKPYVESKKMDGAFPIGMRSGQQDGCDFWMGKNYGGKLASTHEDL